MSDRNYELPEHWAWTRLDNIADIILGQSPPSSTYNIEGEGLPFYQGKAEFGNIYPKPRKWCTSPKKIANEGDVLISVRAPVGPTNICPEKSCVGRGLAAIRGIGGVSSHFILYFIRAFEGVIASKGTGTTFKAITGNQLKRFDVPLPPLPEQQRIVEKIEELFTQLDAGVEELKQAKAQLKHYRQAVLKAAVEGELTREWREAHRDKLEPASKFLERILIERRARWETEELAKMRIKGKDPKDDKWKANYVEPTPPDMEGLPELPEGWVWVTFQQIGKLSRGKSKHRPRNDPKLYGGPYPFVQTGDIRHANGTLREFSQTYNEEGLAQSRFWYKGTLCITIAANIADTAILGFDACFPDSVVGFLATPKHCSIKYIELFLRTAKVDLERYAPATAQKNINLRTLSELAIPFPTVEEQKQFVAKVERRLSVADEIEKELDQALTHAERLRQSILKRAFAGKLVPQDPADEPASMLLEYIKTEIASREGNTNKTGCF